MSNKATHQKTLGSIMRFFVGVELTVELKNGQSFSGTLLEGDHDLSVTLEPNDSTQHKDSSSLLLLQIVQIRGSKILYIHFPPDLDIWRAVKQGVERERAAAKRYQRGVRKGATKSVAP